MHVHALFSSVCYMPHTLPYTRTIGIKKWMCCSNDFKSLLQRIHSILLIFPIQT